MIDLAEFKKTELRVGEIKSAERVPETDKLLKLAVDFGAEQRQIISGIAEFFPEPATLVGKKCVFVYNLAPRVIRGLESQGMILAVKAEAAFSLLIVDPQIPAGTLVG